MDTFPVLQRRGTELHSPVCGEMATTMAHDPAIRSQSEGGYVTSRARFTRIPRRWTVKYDWLSKANKNTVKTFEDDHRAGAASFSWPNPEDGTTYTVRFLKPVTYIPHPSVNFLFWMLDFVLEEV